MTTRPSLSPRGAFASAAAVLVIALWVSGAPAMVYPVYTSEWGLTPLATTTVFAAYPVSLALVLVTFGTVSDHVGRRPVLLAGTAVVAAGTLLFAIAPDTGWLVAGRAVQGAGVGLALSPASASLVEFSRTGPGRASVVNTAATAGGTAVAILLGGALVEYAPAPTRLPFWVLFAAILCVLAALWFFPSSAGRLSSPWRPRPPTVPSGIRWVVFIGTASITASFAMGAVFLALGAQIAKEFIGNADAFASAAVLAGWALVIIPSSWAGRRLRPRTATVIGGALSSVGLLALIPAGATTSLLLFLISSLASGSGYGLLFLGGLGIVNEHAPAQRRAGTLSFVYLVAYLVQGLTAVAVGGSATASDITVAILLWTPIIGGVCLLAGTLAAIRVPAHPG